MHRMSIEGDQRDSAPKQKQILSFFSCTTEEAEEIRSAALRKLRRSLSTRASKIGLRGTGLENCLEDWVNEGYIVAEEQFDRWDTEEGDASHWVYLKAKDLAHRWFERFFMDFRKMHDLVHRGSSLVHDGQSQSKNHYSVYDESVLIADILRNDLSSSDSRILKSYLQGFTIEEIALQEGLSKDTAQRRLNRAQARARNARRSREQLPPPFPPGRTVRPPQRRASS